MPVLLVACFVISGAASLILQVVWVRRLIDVFGASSLAIATVLATFMAGLALGAALGGRLADRLAAARRRRGLAGLVADPLVAYGGCELVVGLAALLVPGAIGALRPLSATLWREFGDTPLALAALRAALVGLVLLIPTTAMGATLPLLTRWVTRRADDLGLLGRRVGTLFAANTLGAVLGAYAAGFHLVPAVGVTAAGHIAAAMALGLAVVVVAVVAVRQRAAARSEAQAGSSEPIVDALAAEPVDAAPVSAGLRRAAIAAYALSGLVAMALEVFLSRALAIVIGSSTYSFALVLVVFLTGIALGAALTSRHAARSRAPALDLALVLAGTALAIVASHALIDELPAVSLALLDGTEFEVDSVLRIHVALSAITILPIALGLGAVVPLVMRLVATELGQVGRDVGRAYAANTAGAIVGALLAGFVLLPVLGLERGLRAAALVDGAAAASLLALAWRAPAPRRRRLAAGLVGVTLIGALLAPGWNLSDFTAGLFRSHLARAYLAAGGLYDREVVYYRDGAATTVSVERAGDHWLLKNNGKVEASNRADMPTQILVGLLPVLLHGGAHQRVFMVGYGSGVTVGALAQAPTVEHLDVAELEPAVYDAADRFFGEFNHRPEDDPRVVRKVGDGRNLLLAAPERYDVIVSEPSNPWIAGVASLFSRDFYALAKERLAPGGIYCQWAQLYELGPTSVKMIYRTFASEFPYVYAFTPGDETTDTILIGSLAPIDLSLGRLDRVMAAPTVRAELERAMVTTAEDLVGALFLAPDEVASFTAGAELNTDDNARLEHIAPRDLLAAVRGNRFARSVRGETWPYGHLDDVVTGTAGREAALGRALLGYGRRREAGAWLAGAGAGRDVVGRVLALTAPVDFVDPELVVTAGGPPLAPPSALTFADPTQAAAGLAALTAAYPLIAEGRWDAAWRKLASLPARADDDAGRDVTLLVAYTAYKAVELGRARALLESLDAVGHGRLRPAVGYYLGRAAYGLGAFRAGVHALEQFATLHPALADQVLAERLPPRAAR